MKKIMSIIALAILAVLLTGCQNAATEKNEYGEITRTDLQGALQNGWGFAYEEGGSYRRIPDSVYCSKTANGKTPDVISRDSSTGEGQSAESGTLVCLRDPEGLKAWPVKKKQYILPLVFDGDTQDSSAYYIIDDSAVEDLDSPVAIPVASLTAINSQNPQEYLTANRQYLGNGSFVLSYPLRTAVTIDYTDETGNKSVSMDTQYSISNPDGADGIPLTCTQTENGAWAVDTSSLAPGKYIIASDSTEAGLVTIK